MMHAPIHHSFNGGELSPLLRARADVRLTQIGGAVMENFAPCIEGPMQKRPGFRRVRAAMASASWLAPFVFNTTQSYVLECGEGAIRFYTNDGRIEDGGGLPLEIVVPHAAAEWPSVSMQQSYDRLYLAHGSHPPGALIRTGAETFAWATLALTNGPFADDNVDKGRSVTVTGSLVVGSIATITVASGAALFAAGHVGALFRVEALDFSDIKAWEVGSDTSPGDLRRSDGKVYKSISANNETGTIQPTHDEGAEWDGGAATGSGGVLWEYQHDRFGILSITAVAGDGLSATATVLRRVPSSCATVASWRWAKGAFSNADGWPNLVFIWNGRLCFWKRFELYGSVVGEFANFQQFTSSGYIADDLAFRLVLAAPDPPQWVIVDRELLIGTASDEYAIGAVNAAEAVSAANIRATKQSSYGSAPIWPVEPGTSVIFAQRGATQMREAEYDFGRDRYVAANINRWARHIARSGIRQMGFQRNTEELLFAVTGDGQLVLRSYDPEQEVKGFARVVAGQDGRILSTVTVPSTDGTVDDIWALIEWDGARSVQQMARWWVPGSAVAHGFFVDDGLSDSLDEPSTTISSLNHLIGCTVAVLADGNALAPMVVPDSGTLTLPFAARERVVGRGYAALFESLPSGMQMQNGGLAWGLRQRLVKMMLAVLDTARIFARGNRRRESLLDRSSGADFAEAQALFTGYTANAAIESVHDRDGVFRIETDEFDPRPAFVLAAQPAFSIE